MQVFQTIYDQSQKWNPGLSDAPENVHLVFCTGDIDFFEQEKSTIRQQFPKAEIIGCSTVASINDDFIVEKALVVSALSFEHSMVSTFGCDQIDDFLEQFPFWLKKLDSLRAIILLTTDASRHNASWMQEVADQLPSDVLLAGALASNHEPELGELFYHKQLAESGVIAVALCGDGLTIEMGALGGWDSIGQEFEVTKTKGNVLYELNEKPALQVYRDALAEKGHDLFTDTIKFPLCVRPEDNAFGYIRAITNIDTENGSIEFGGPMIENTYARICKTNPNQLLDGAAGASTQVIQKMKVLPEFVLVFSSVRRQQILADKIEQEVDIIREDVGEQATIAGFYTFGAIAPLFESRDFVLQNQTISVLAIHEQALTVD
jgi:hypothetical protein